MSIYICKKCGYLKGYMGNPSYCPVCNSTLTETDLDDIIYLKMSEYEIDQFRRTIQSKEQYDQDLWQKRLEYDDNRSYQIQQQTASNIHCPKCPTCGSTNIQKISVTKKALGAFSFGLLSKTARSQFECKNCGYKW